jgi:hypothetical protein
MYLSFVKAKREGDIVTMEVWYNAGHKEALKFLSKWGRLDESISGLVEFYPRVFSFKCSEYHCLHKEKCINDGEYCALKPNDVETTEKVIIQETLYQACLY